ncbi:unnamed protein product [Acanthosepion pharaonis]|uniref:Uncharacterized protein n=1 Tax=Acanthosepion pharaonis TaxID=158019 RepID=A0A812BLC4_ACAPH|nr:unnamed protein product [Sepia pharaonis]
MLLEVGRDLERRVGAVAVKREATRRRSNPATGRRRQKTPEGVTCPAVEENFYIYLSTDLSLYLSKFIHIYLRLFISIYLSISLSKFIHICLSIYLSKFIHICLSVYLSIYLSKNKHKMHCLHQCQTVHIYLSVSIYLRLFTSVSDFSRLSQTVHIYLGPFTIYLSLYLSLPIVVEEQPPTLAICLGNLDFFGGDGALILSFFLSFFLILNFISQVVKGQ